MPKNNLFFNYLSSLEQPGKQKNGSVLPITLKYDRLEQAYYYIPLALSQPNEQAILEHHFSIYQDQVRTAEWGEYHYTATLGTYVIHVYFNSANQIIRCGRSTAGPLSPLSDEECAAWTKQASELLQSVIIPLKQQMLDEITKLETQYRTTERQSTQASLAWITNKTAVTQSAYLDSLQEVEKTLQQLTLLVDPAYTFYEGALRIIGNIIRGIKASLQTTAAACQASPVSSATDQADAAPVVATKSTTTSAIMQTMASARATTMLSLSKLQEKIEEIEGLVKSLSTTPSKENILNCNDRMGIVVAHLQEREDLSPEMSAKLYDAQVTLRDTAERFVQRALLQNDQQSTETTLTEPWEGAACYLSSLGKEWLLNFALLKKRPRLLAYTLKHMDHNQIQKPAKIGMTVYPSPMRYCLDYLDAGMIPCVAELAKHDSLAWFTEDRSGYPIAHTVLSHQDREHPLRDSLFNQHTTQSDLTRLYRGLIEKLTDHLQKPDLPEERRQSLKGHIQHYQNQLANRVPTLLAMMPRGVSESARLVTDPHHFGQQLTQDLPEVSSLMQEVQAHSEINQKTQMIYQESNTLLDLLRTSTKDREERNRRIRAARTAYGTDLESFLETIKQNLSRYMQTQIEPFLQGNPNVSGNREALLTKALSETTHLLDGVLDHINHAKELIRIHTEAEKINSGKRCSNSNKKRLNVRIQTIKEKIREFQTKMQCRSQIGTGASAATGTRTVTMQFVEEAIQKEGDRRIKMREMSTQLHNLYSRKEQIVQLQTEMLDQLKNMDMDVDTLLESLPDEWKAKFSSLEEESDALEQEIHPLKTAYKKLEQECALSVSDIQTILPASGNPEGLSSEVMLALLRQIVGGALIDEQPASTAPSTLSRRP
jgi:hypothetical protein